MKLARSNLNELPQVIDEIHDKYFDIDKVEYDREQRIFRLLFSDNKWGPYERSLEVFGVHECFIEDTEQIGIYCLNVLSFGSNASTITILCDVPLKIRLEVGPEFTVVVR